jgi:hypothetical protein
VVVEKIKVDRAGNIRNVIIGEAGQLPTSR